MNLADTFSALDRAQEFLTGQEGKTAQYRKGRAGQLLEEVEQALQFCRHLMLELHQAKRGLRETIKKTNSCTPLSPAIP